MIPRDVIRTGVGVAVIGTAALAGLTVFAMVAVAERVRRLLAPPPPARVVELFTTNPGTTYRVPRPDGSTWSVTE